MMEYIFGIITNALPYALIPLIISLFFTQIGINNFREEEKCKHSKHIVVCYPKAFLYVGFAEIVFCMFCAIVAYKNFLKSGSSLGTMWLFIGFSLLGWFVVFNNLNFKIEFTIGEDCFIYRTFFRRTYVLKYSECVLIKHTRRTYVFTARGKVFYADKDAINFDRFYNVFDKRSKKDFQ